VATYDEKNDSRQQDIWSHEVQVLAPEADGSQQYRLWTKAEAREIQTSEPETLTDSESESRTRYVSGWPTKA